MSNCEKPGQTDSCNAWLCTSTTSYSVGQAFCISYNAVKRQEGSAVGNRARRGDPAPHVSSDEYVDSVGGANTGCRCEAKLSTEAIALHQHVEGSKHRRVLKFRRSGPELNRGGGEQQQQQQQQQQRVR